MAAYYNDIYDDDDDDDDDDKTTTMMILMIMMMMMIILMIMTIITIIITLRFIDVHASLAAIKNMIRIIIYFNISTMTSHVVYKLWPS